MRVWIGCLACYNEGRLIGEWFDAADAGSVTVEAIHDLPDARVLLARTDDSMPGFGDDLSSHEELWVFDVDEAPHESLSKEMSPADAQAFADALGDLPESEAGAFFAWADLHGYNVAYEIESLSLMVGDFEESYCGEWDSREEYAQNLAEELGSVPQEHSWPASYIDWERAARDLFMDYSDMPAPGGRIYVFRSN